MFFFPDDLKKKHLEIQKEGGKRRDKAFEETKLGGCLGDLGLGIRGESTEGGLHREHEGG